jgi:chemotaxis protein histidine kinase CheA
MSPELRRLTYALLLSLLIHTLLLSLTFGGQGFWVPSFGFPWQVRRIEVPDLRVVLVPPDTAVHPAVTPVAEPSQQAWVEQPVASGSVPTPSVSRVPTPGPFAAAILSEASPSADAKPSVDAKPRTDAKPGTLAKPRTDVKARTDKSRTDVAGAASAKAPLHADRPGGTALPPIPPPDVIALERPDEATWMVPTTPAMPTADIAAAPSTSSPQTAMPSLQDASDATRAGIDQEASEKAVELTKLEPSTQQGQREQEQLEAARQDAILQEATRAEVARLEAERQEAARQAATQQEAQRQETARQEAARAEIARLEAERQQAARQAAAQQEAQRQETARQEAARAEVARLEAERQEAARQAAAQQEGQRQETARQEVARAEVARLEAERQEAARQAAAQQEAQRQETARQEAARAEVARIEAERQEAARQAAAQQEAQRQETARQEAARREAVLRAIGRQLDEEAARREAASNAARLPNTLPLSLSTARRVRLWGRTHPNAELVQYAEAWAQKIQFNTPVETVREMAKRPHTAPMVTVAIRSDGSVESVTIDVSSGVAQIDEAIRRIVEAQRPYLAFPTALAREFDVVEIRRTWHFDSAVRLY